MKRKKHREDFSHPDSKQVSLFREYLYANVWFFLFLAAAALAAFFLCGAVWDDVFKQTVRFLFLVLGGGFVLVSVLDWLYDRHLVGDGEEEPS